jgi:ribulose-phosphate 3-epimerase
LIELAPSILSADFARLAGQVHPAIEGGATVLHVDVMDGHFVPNLTLGPAIVAALRKEVEVPLDCHLMIENPDEFIPAFIEAGANWISVHQEACVHLHRTVEHIKSHGALAGVVVNPATPVATLEAVLHMVDYVLKIQKLAMMRAAHGHHFRIEVDGGVAVDTIADVVRAGAEVLVAGSAIFGHGDIRQNVEQLLQKAHQATVQRV